MSRPPRETPRHPVAGVVRSFERPDEEDAFELGRTATVHLGGFSLGLNVHEPGWSWSACVKPVVGTERCQFHHVGYIVSGRMRWVLADGTILEGSAGDVFDISPGHDGMVLGDEPCVSLDWVGGVGWARPPETGERILTTLLFTDIVDSTAIAVRMGDAAWRRLLAAHDEEVRFVLSQHRGQEIKTTGDGFLAAFDSPARAIRAAVDIRGQLRRLGLGMRGAVHTGEVEVKPGDVGGVAVHEAARMMAAADPGEIIVSATTRELISASGIATVDRGTHQLKGLKGERRLFAVAHDATTP